jgi:3-hydroxyisobutyrate dehydrogenase-like beta-hydroxyacid dehydrogenase
VYNRTRAKADGLVARGAIWHDDAGSAAAAANVVITMVGLPQDVEEIYFGTLVDVVDVILALLRRAEELTVLAAERGLDLSAVSAFLGGDA